ncbi:MAG: GNAT family N-acetyltransferase [Verrucomicrobia bacterium]|nr:GNAT family N-acetyltransferase [Verrucomicrobiota bacterium]
MARREEGEDVLQTVLLSLSMDSSWNDSYAMAEHYLTSMVGRLFNETEPLCLVIQKGNRLIAASLLDPDPEAVHQLVSGPMVTTEYRNRGIGSRLLHASLAALQERGLTRASGITRDRTVAARHVYTKFGSVSESFSFPSLLDGRREAKA